MIIKSFDDVQMMLHPKLALLKMNMTKGLSRMMAVRNVRAFSTAPASMIGNNAVYYRLQWEKVKQQTGYKVYYIGTDQTLNNLAWDSQIDGSFNPEDPGVDIDLSAAPLNLNITNSGIYWFRVTGINGAGNEVALADVPVSLGRYLGAFPTGFTANADQLSWTGVADAGLY
ncbi:MAG TPA: hypothetical protein VEC37_10100, partial [Bacillota bacterium]|nr:hypothetical protein [Bacillota bacterium]